MWRSRLAVVGVIGLLLPAGTGAGSSHNARFLVVATGDAKSLGPPRVELFDGRGRLERVIATADREEWEAQWSPDRSRLAWVDPRGIVVANRDGSAARHVFRSRPGCGLQCSDRFAWAPDGRRLAISADDTQRRTSRLFVLTLASRTTRELVPSPSKLNTYCMVVGWSPRGEWIAYTRDTESPVRGPTADLSLVRPDGGGRHRVYLVGDALKDGPSVAWSPNGRYLAFTTDHFAPYDPKLGVIDVATGKLRRIRRVPAVNTGFGPPAWSPDSRRIAVPGAFGYFTVSPLGTHVRRFRPAGTGFAWSRRTGDLFVVLSPNVFVSAHAEAQPKLLFRMPRRQGILALDVY